MSRSVATALVMLLLGVAAGADASAQSHQASAAEDVAPSAQSDAEIGPWTLERLQEDGIIHISTRRGIKPPISLHLLEASKPGTDVAQPVVHVSPQKPQQ